ncbi:MAG: GGDEF domain-containing protein [Cellvibrionaceae bacterium]|nr:GGDEF domain-containing protein [Cellvibrionaceae bacterium]
MSGPWFGYSGLLIPPHQLETFKPNRLVQMPGRWSIYADSQRSDGGVMTLWADIHSAKPSETMVILPGLYRSAARVYLQTGAGVEKLYDNLSPLIAEAQQLIVQVPHKAQQGLLLAPPPKQLSNWSGSGRLIVHLYASDSRDAQALKPPQLVAASQLQSSNMRRTALYGVLFGALLLMALYTVFLACFSSRRRRLHITIATLCAVAGGRVLVSGELMLEWLAWLPVHCYFYLCSVLACISVAALIFLQRYIMPGLWRPNWAGALIYTTACIPLIVLFVPFVFDYYIFVVILEYGVKAYLSLTIVYCLLLLFLISERRSNWQLMLLVLGVAISVCLDIIVYLQGRTHSIDLFPIATLIAIFIYAGNLGWSYVKLSAREQGLQESLDDLNESLEKHVKIRTQALARANEKLTLAALTDSLTGLPNRRAFDREMATEIKRCKRNHSPLSLAVADIDWFKRINDRYGHEFGDKVLKALGRALRRRLRETDVIARIGGEEFAIILPNTASAEAVTVLEECRAVVNKMRFLQLPELTVGISVGVASWQPWLSASDLYKHADEAMYEAKKAGRNQVRYATFFVGTEQA